MKSSYDSKTSADTKYVSVGMGHYVAFRCPECNLSKSTVGRRKQWVPKLGRQFVCKSCVRVN